MTLPFAGFPTATFAEMGTAATVLATIRAECDRLGRCRKDQRFLAAKAGLKLPTLNYHVKRFERLGVITLIKYSRRKSAVILIRPEHRWVTPEKPAPKPSECSTFLNTSSKATLEKEPPVTPQRGEAEPVFEKSGEGEPARQRRTLKGQPRRPRRPRAPRQRQRKAGLLDAFMAAAARDEPTTAPPARPALPPPPDIIPPGHELVDGEVIPMPREPLPRQRGFSPATDIWEAFKYAAEKPETRNRAEHCHVASPLLATG